MELNNQKHIKSEVKTVKKASDKHKQLANFIKEIHGQLRNEYKILGAEKAWKNHMLQDEKLKEYAKSMYQLATEHWSQQPSSSTPLTYCRIEWFKNQCKDYFVHGGMKKFDDKEKHLMTKYIEESNDIVDLERIETTIESKVKVLDVGSCYNPFSEETLFSVTAIDIAPYSSDVIKCDFLNLNIEDKKIFKDETLIALPKHSFNAVTFSLLLEYIPCSTQRYLCCKKAYDLLKEGGILFIATPDSKHEGANTKIINTSWKVTLAKLGFMRVRYEKLQHIHCLIFRKCFYQQAALKRINWKKISQDDSNELFSSKFQNFKIFIPQDFHEAKPKKDVIQNFEKFKVNEQELITLFNELPCED